MSHFRQIVKIYFLFPDQFADGSVRQWSAICTFYRLAITTDSTAHKVPLLSCLRRYAFYRCYYFAFVHSYVLRYFGISSYWSPSCHLFFLQYFVRSRCVAARLNFLANFATGLLFLLLRLLLRGLLAIIYSPSTHPLVSYKQSLLKRLSRLASCPSAS